MLRNCTESDCLNIFKVTHKEKKTLFLLCFSIDEKCEVAKERENTKSCKRESGGNKVVATSWASKYYFRNIDTSTSINFCITKKMFLLWHRMYSYIYISLSSHNHRKGGPTSFTHWCLEEFTELKDDFTRQAVHQSEQLPDDSLRFSSESKTPNHTAKARISWGCNCWSQITNGVS